MNILDIIQQRLKAGSRPTKRTAAGWAGLLLGLLLVLLAGSYMKHQPNLSAESRAPLEAQAVISSGGGQEQEILKVARSADTLASKPSIWPVNGEITSGFGWRTSPWGEGNEMHAGIDIANSMETPIVATADGEVVQTGWAGGYGNVVQLSHGNGIVTVYGHNSRIAVKTGEPVKKGQIIAYMGSTGRSTGPHVHYEIRVNGTAVDPISFLVAY